MLAYLPLLAFLSLALASSLSAKRSLKVVGGGSLMMLVIVSIFSALPVLSILSDAGVLSDDTAAPIIIGLLWRAVVSPGMMFILPALLCWMLIAITREKLEHLQTQSHFVTSELRSHDGRDSAAARSPRRSTSLDDADHDQKPHHAGCAFAKARRFLIGLLREPLFRTRHSSRSCG